ncbi:hypothetical protein LJC42_01725 [Eubacteriales bacterium OttesenSCG-928-K08]|nr:hypothetical protein [Eubacteriales bacterium OttesenSCG-928-K08]
MPNVSGMVVKTSEEYEAAIRQMQAKANKLSQNLQTLPARAVVKIAMNILSASVLRAPVHDGILRAGGYLLVNGMLLATGNADGSIEVLSSEDIPLNDRINIRIGFRAFSEDGYDYALYQHEHIEFKHPMGGQAKFLEASLDENTPELVTAIRDAMQQAKREAIL